MSIDCASSIPTPLELKSEVLSKIELKQSKFTDIPLGKDNYHQLATHGERVRTKKERRFNRNNDKMRKT